MRVSVELELGMLLSNDSQLQLSRQNSSLNSERVWQRFT